MPSNSPNMLPVIPTDGNGTSSRTNVSPCFGLDPSLEKLLDGAGPAAISPGNPLWPFEFRRASTVPRRFLRRLYARDCGDATSFRPGPAPIRCDPGHNSPISGICSNAETAEIELKTDGSGCRLPRRRSDPIQVFLLRPLPPAESPAGACGLTRMRWIWPSGGSLGLRELTSRAFLFQFLQLPANRNVIEVTQSVQIDGRACVRAPVWPRRTAWLQTATG